MEHRAAIYCRISQDTEGEAIGVTTQEQDCRALVKRNGWTVTDVYVDNDLGASTRSRAKSRPRFDAMVKAATMGTVDVIVAYSNSRLTRRPLELESLIGLHEKHGVRFATVVSGNDDLSTADGRMVARIKSNVDAAEVERTAERVARHHLHNAQQGIPVGGTRPFGWMDDKVTVVPAEARLIRQAAADLIAGMPTRQVCAAWNAAGVLTSRGNPWRLATLRQMMLSPRLAGWRVYRGEVCLDNDGKPVRGRWEPIVDDATHEALKRRLARSERRTRIPRRNARHYLLTGVARCGVCNAPMYGARASEDYFYYRCGDSTGPAGKHIVSISGHGLDDLVTGVVVARLERESFDVTPAPFDGQAELEDVEAQIRELMDAYKARALTGAVVFPAVRDLETRRDELVSARSDAQAAQAATTLQTVTAGTFGKMGRDRRRAVVETLMDAVIVRPAERRGNTFDPDRVEIVWKGGK